MRTSDRGIDLIKSYEGVRLQPYICAGGVLTIGYGHTGKDVIKGMTITAIRAIELLRDDVGRFETHVESKAKRTLFQNEFDALVSICFNCGYIIKGELEQAINLADTLTVVKKMNLYINVTSRKMINGESVKIKTPLLGLQRRRLEESAMYCEFPIKNVRAMGTVGLAKELEAMLKFIQEKKK